MRRRLLASACAALALALPAAAAATPLPPSLSFDTAFAPPSGIAQDDFAAGTATDVANGTAVDGDRIYTVGEVRGPGGDNDIGVTVRRRDGTLDPSFSGDGRLTLGITPGERDFGVGVAVLPDHRIRILGATDTTAGTATNLRPVIVGLTPDGSPDPGFGTAGVVTFQVGYASSVPGGMAIADDGRIAIAGTTADAAGSGAHDDTFVSVRGPDGSPAPGFGTGGATTVNRGGGTFNDEGVDVAFRPGGGVVALAQVATATGSDAVLLGFTDAGVPDPAFSGDGDLVLAVGDSSTQPGSLIVYGGRLLMTGSTKVGSATQAFLARVNADGGDLQSRTFDLRGQLVAAGQTAVSKGLDLAVVPGLPPTLVVVGSVAPSTTTYWAARAFNGLDGDVASFGTGDIAVPTVSVRGLAGVAAGDGWAAVAGDIRDATTGDTSFGTGRLLVDADKSCDLGLTVARPLELVLGDAAPATLDLVVANHGTRTCGGTITAPDAYPLTFGGTPGPVSTGLLEPGATFTATGVGIGYSGPRKREDTLSLTLNVAGDAAPDDNAKSLHVVFHYCDLALAAVHPPAVVPSEGARRFSFSVRNVGTVPCTQVRLAAHGARVAPVTAPYTVGAGLSVADDLSATVLGAHRPGARVRLSFAPRGHDVNAANDTVRLTPAVVGVGDTDARRPTGDGSVLSGVARRGKGHLAARLLRVARVEVAVRRVGRGCRRMVSRSGRFATQRAGRHGCAPVWVRADGTTRWRLSLGRPLGPGRYVLESRATLRMGFREARFSSADRNRLSFFLP